MKTNSNPYQSTYAWRFVFIFGPSLHLDSQNTDVALLFEYIKVRRTMDKPKSNKESNKTEKSVRAPASEDSNVFEPCHEKTNVLVPDLV